MAGADAGGRDSSEGGVWKGAHAGLPRTTTAAKRQAHHTEERWEGELGSWPRLQLAAFKQGP